MHIFISVCAEVDINISVIMCVEKVEVLMLNEILHPFLTNFGGGERRFSHRNFTHLELAFVYVQSLY